MSLFASVSTSIVGQSCPRTRVSVSIDLKLEYSQYSSVGSNFHIYIIRQERRKLISHKGVLTKSHYKMCVVNYFLFQYKMLKYILRKRKEQQKHDRVPLLNDNEDDDNSQYNAIE